ncbi:MAG: NAD(P)-dependent alcohol dehydrogenase [Allobranchiibius sp.]
MTTTSALSVGSPSGTFEAGSIELRDLREDDVRIDVKFAGICHSDIHQVREEWGSATFPMVPGHEIAGVVAEIGDSVTRVKVGDHVGVGCLVDSCGECEFCKEGFEQHCTKGAVVTYNGTDYYGENTKGGYAKAIVVSERFVLTIPDGLGLDVAAPLLCAGVTTYSPLRRWGAGPGSKVAVIGMGGLGHMGVKLAAAMGAEVTVLSRTTDKEADSREFGATAHLATKDEKVFQEHQSYFDIILNTVSADLPMGDYVALLKPRGVMVSVGLPNNNYEIAPGSLIGSSKVLAGSMIGGIPETQEMLDFCAKHDFGATVEVISADEVDKAYDTVVDGKVRYRFVIDTSTISA